jgi:hypothetical protein
MPRPDGIDVRPMAIAVIRAVSQSPQGMPGQQ